MARGQARAASNQLNLTNRTAAGYGANAGQLFGTLVPRANELINSTGFSPADLSAITNASMGGVNAAFGDAENQLKRSVSQSGNPAGIGGQLDALARSKGIAGGEAAGNVQIANANERDKLRQEGLDLMNSLFNTSVGAQTNLLGLGPGTLQARAAGPSGAQDFSSVLGAITGSGKAGFDAYKACWVIRAIYGDDSPMVDLIRSAWTQRWARQSKFAAALWKLYLKVGPTVAAAIKRLPLLKALFKPVTDWAARKALRERSVMCGTTSLMTN